jgi:tetratricopeptide (TPR) repeat protein
MLGAALAAAVIVQMWQSISITRLCAVGVLVGTSALTFVQAGYWQEDLLLWNHSYNVNPHSFAALWQLGRTLAGRAAAARVAGDSAAARDENDRAIFFLEKGLVLDPHSWESHRALGELYFVQGDYAKAVEHYQAARPYFPSDADLHSNLGIALAHLHQYAAAMTAMAEAIRLKPNNAGYEANLGNMLGEQGDRAGAAEHFRRALAIDPKFAPARDGLQKVTGP